MLKKHFFGLNLVHFVLYNFSVHTSHNHVWDYVHEFLKLKKNNIKLFLLLDSTMQMYRNGHKLHTFYIRSTSWYQYCDHERVLQGNPKHTLPHQLKLFQKTKFKKQKQKNRHICAHTHSSLHTSQSHRNCRHLYKYSWWLNYRLTQRPEVQQLSHTTQQSPTPAIYCQFCF